MDTPDLLYRAVESPEIEDRIGVARPRYGCPGRQAARRQGEGALRAQSRGVTALITVEPVMARALDRVKAAEAKYEAMAATAEKLERPSRNSSLVSGA